MMNENEFLRPRQPDDPGCEAMQAINRVRYIIWGLLAICILALVALAVILTQSIAHAHQAPSGWTYDAWCCNTMDCAKIPARSVKLGPNGYVVTLNPGDHPVIVAPQSYFVPYGTEKPSGDMDFHACILPGQLDVMRCFYAPEGGV